MNFKIVETQLRDSISFEVGNPPIVRIGLSNVAANIVSKDKAKKIVTERCNTIMAMDRDELILTCGRTVGEAKTILLAEALDEKDAA